MLIDDDPEFFECELITVPPKDAFRAAAEVYSCEFRNPDAQIPFDWLLRDVMNRPGMYEFILQEPAKCPKCLSPVTEKTLVEPGGVEGESEAQRR